MQHRVKSKIEKGSQYVPAGQVPRKAAAFEEFKQAPAHLREVLRFVYLENHSIHTHHCVFLRVLCGTCIEEQTICHLEHLNEYQAVLSIHTMQNS